MPPYAVILRDTRTRETNGETEDRLNTGGDALRPRWEISAQPFGSNEQRREDQLSEVCHSWQTCSDEK